MATLPTSEGENRVYMMMAGSRMHDCQCACHQGHGPALGLKARPETFKELLPEVSRLIEHLTKLAGPGSAEAPNRLAEVDLCLLHMLEDWVVLSKAEIEQAPKP